MNFSVLGDVHLGLRRTTGVTKQSLAAFTNWQFQYLHGFLMEVLPEDKPVLFMGDLFDSGSVDFGLVLRLIQLFESCTQQIYILRGNHDIMKDRTRLSALEFLGKVCDQVTVIDEPIILDEYALVPHMPNQTLFNEAVMDCAGKAKVLITHANYDNEFTENSDHSLNLSPAQARRFDFVVCGHEHAPRKDNNVFLTGGLFPTKVEEAADRIVWSLSPDEIRELTRFSPRYADVYWRDLDDTRPDVADFICVTGEAPPDEASAFIMALSRFRQHSDAFMIQNSVKVRSEGLHEIQDAAIDKFDALKALLSILPADVCKALEGLGLCN
jgi:predicted phosphodiesterase